MKDDGNRKGKRIYLETVTDPKQPLLLYLSGKTVSEVAEMLGCERRTAARLIRSNLDTSDIGRWDTSHKKLCGYTEIINVYVNDNIDDYSSVIALSRDLFHLLKKSGYTGSERTIRNYLNQQEHIYGCFHATGG